jgi:hypothetical protein
MKRIARGAFHSKPNQLTLMRGLPWDNCVTVNLLLPEIKQFLTNSDGCYKKCVDVGTITFGLELSNKIWPENPLFLIFLSGRKAAPVKDFKSFRRAFTCNCALQKLTNP